VASLADVTSHSGVLCLTCDNMGSAYEVGIGGRAGPDPDEPSLSTGYPRLLDLFERLSLKASFFIEGWNALHHPERVRELVDRGHEVGLHGWVHEKYATLGRIEAERTLIDSMAAFRNIGIRPAGFRAPGGVRGVHAVDILSDLCLSYDSSIDRDATAREMSFLTESIINIPWQWSMNDYYTYHMAPDEDARTCHAAEAQWNRMVDDVAENGGLVTFTFHAMCTGVDPEKLAVLERVLLRAMQARVEILTAGEAASRFRDAQKAST
jgi:peptidoglycan-N-acetylglucosamine deacetylase